MPQFLTRVELHDAAHGDAAYDILHAGMEKNDFKREIPTTEGTRRLPTAEYYYSGSVQAYHVWASAKEAADATGKKSEIITVEFGHLYTDGTPA